MAGSDVKVNLRSLGEIMPPEVRRALLQRAGAHAIGIIKRRTARGIDAEGVPFRPYSKRYAKLRAGSGRATKPDLLLTGGMLQGMTLLDVNEERALIGFTGSTTAVAFRRMRTKKGAVTSRKTKRWTETRLPGGVVRRRQERITHTLARKAAGRPVANAVKAKAHNDGTGKVPRRHFFALSPEEKREVIAEAARTLRIGLTK